MVDVTRPPLRADAARNRASLLAVATRVFATSEAEPSMRAIAADAGVGIGTLYRHFPTRAALVDAVYHDQVERLTAGAQELLQTYPPAEALRRWMDLFGDWVATKQGMLRTLAAMVDSGAMVHAQSRSQLLAAVTAILDAGRVAGDLRTDVTAEDVTASLLGSFTAASSSAQAARLMDLLVDGLTARSVVGNTRPSRS